jgi:hypothetical protein
MFSANSALLFCAKSGKYAGAKVVILFGLAKFFDLDAKVGFFLEKQKHFLTTQLS